MAAVPQRDALPMPDGPLSGPDAWLGRDMQARQDWLEVFEDADIQELDAALRQFQASGRPLIELTPQTFPLPGLGERFRAARDDLLHGRGFTLFRGLPVEQYDIAETAAIYFGIGAYLGKPVSQNAKGHLLGHVIDMGRSTNDMTARTYQTNERQYYHADSCDIVGLLCLRKARQGGASTIVSSVQLYNEVLVREPELLPELFAPVCVDRRGEIPSGAKPWYEVPVFNWVGDKLTTYFIRRYIESAQRFDAVPALSEKRVAAYDLFEAIADEPGVHLSMAFEPGDIQFLHNHQILHDRTAFQDFDDPAARRHLLRLWLCPPGGRQLPQAYRQRWGSIEPGDRGGIVVEGAALKTPLIPE